MKNYTEFCQINESFDISPKFKKDIDSLFKNSFNDQFSRIEFQLNKEYIGGKFGYMYKSIENTYTTHGSLDSIDLFRKKTLNPNAQTYSYHGFTTLNYKGVPLVSLLKVEPSNTSVFSTTGIIDSNKFAIFTMLAFDSNIDKAIEFFNKRFLSALGLEIDKNHLIIREAEDLIKNSDIDFLAQKENIRSISDIVLKENDFVKFDKLVYIKKREANPKSDKEKQIIDKTNFYIDAITKYLEYEFKDNEKYFNFGLYKFPKKSNPIRLVIGMNKNVFKTYTSILTHEFFTKYKVYFDKLNKIYAIFEPISDKVNREESYENDSKSFIIDVFKISQHPEIEQLLNSYGSVSKFNLF